MKQPRNINVKGDQIYLGPKCRFMKTLIFQTFLAHSSKMLSFLRIEGSAFEIFNRPRVAGAVL